VSSFAKSISATYDGVLRAKQRGDTNSSCAQTNMKITRPNEHELVTVDSTLWLSAFFLLASLPMFYVALHSSKSAWWGAGFFLLSAFLCLQKSTFAFDGVRRSVTWRVLKFGRQRGGELPFDAIRGITIETSRGESGGQTYRLALVTADGPVSLATPYSSGQEQHHAMREELLTFLKGAGAAVKAQSEYEEPIQNLQLAVESLLKQGRKIDAIALLRSEQKLSLTEAHTRVTEMEKAMKTGKSPR
jgi:hypothetical protein